MPDEHVSSNRMPHSLYLYFSVTSLSPTHANYRLRHIAAHTADIHRPKHVGNAHIITETYFVLSSLFFLLCKRLLNIIFLNVLTYYYTFTVYTSTRTVYSCLYAAHIPSSQVHTHQPFSRPFLTQFLFIIQDVILRRLTSSNEYVPWLMKRETSSCNSECKGNEQIYLQFRNTI